MDAADLRAFVNSVCNGGCGGAPNLIAVEQPCAGKDFAGLIQSDSRKVRAGGVFVAVRGVNVDGHDFVGQAVERGAAVIVAEKSAEQLENYSVGRLGNVALVRVADSAEALGRLAHAAWGRPTDGMTVLGVTGTNGKTTVAYLVRSILESAGVNCGLLGTVEYYLGDGQVVKAANTTPDALALAEMMAAMRKNRQRAVVMECSSHGLDQRRTAGIKFSAAAFTNLTGDHMDYHGSGEEYLKAKTRLFESLSDSAAAILNADDPAGDLIAEQTGAKVWRFSLRNNKADITAGKIEMGIWGSKFKLTVHGESVSVRTGLIGEHNISNCLAGAGLAFAAGRSLEEIAAGIGALKVVPGRLERVGEDASVTVLVDYAHTDDALDHALSTVRRLTTGRVIVVFGCGGDRDRSKRPRMAKVAARLADVVLVTNDNPRTEDPDQIFADIREGFAPGELSRVTEISDRRTAISSALVNAGPEDVVLIAGKGHEDYQLVGDKVLEFDDRQVARQILLKKF